MADSDDSTSRFTDLYKNKSRKEHHQSERRRALLDEQKRLRQTEIDSGRPGLLESIEAENAESDSVPMDTQHQQRRRKLWFTKLYRDKLQLSEWMYEKPDDLNDWFLVPCPVGTRCLLVITKESVVAYDKTGQSVTGFSNHPGIKQRVTVLDCIVTKHKIFYAFDLLVYNKMDLVECECQFRFQWLRSKLEEDDLQKRFFASKDKGWRLELLPVFDFKARDQIEDCLARYPMFAEEDTPLDGLLFYHKESNYIYGKTPLITWLFPFMVPNILGEEWSRTLNHQYLKNIPNNYKQLGCRAYMDKFDAKLAKKRERRSKARLRRMKKGGDEHPVTDEGEPAILEEMDAVPGDGESSQDEKQKEVDEMERLEMEG